MRRWFIVCVLLLSPVFSLAVEVENGTNVHRLVLDENKIYDSNGVLRINVGTTTSITGALSASTMAVGGLNVGASFSNLNTVYSVFNTVNGTLGYSAFIVGATADYTLVESTNGLGSNMWYSNMDGDYTWGQHVNLPATALGQVAYGAGVHGADTSGLFVVVDSTNGIPINIMQSVAITTSPMIALHAETLYGNALYPGGTPTYSGTFNGDFIRAKKRGVNMFVVNSSGAVTSYDTAGSGYVSMYNNNAASIIQSPSDPIAFLAGSGQVDQYSASLTQLMSTVVSATGDASFDVTGGTITVGGGAVTDIARMNGLLELYENSAPRTNVTPGRRSRVISNTGQTPVQICISTGPLISQWALLSNTSTPCSN